MGLVSSSIPNLINGVSQQPYLMRLSSQCEMQQNALASVVTGLGVRPPSRHKARLLTTALTGAHLHTINRDATERYTVVLTNGAISVYDMAGNAKTVTTPDGVDYLTSSDPENDFSCTTVQDYTFIANKTITAVRDDASAPAARPYEALIFVKQGGYLISYTLTVGATTVVFKTANAGSNDNAAFLATDFIASKLYEALTNLSPTVPAGCSLTTTGPTMATAGIGITLLGSCIYLYKSGADFTVTASDGLGDTALIAAKGSIQHFTDLPQKGVDGFTIRVEGNAETTVDDFWVHYKADSTHPNGGIWEECAKPAEDVNMDASTMPHTLVRNGDGTFTFGQATWDERKVGDLTTTGFPSFEGQKINEVFFYRNRLGFLSGENTILSRDGKFFNFHRESAIQVLDTDPIDIAQTNTRAATLYHALPFNSTLLLSSEAQQFQLAQDTTLSTKTVAINVATAFDVNVKAKPVVCGLRAYFATNRGNWSAIREYFVDPFSRSTDAPEITSHIPHYIPTNVRKLAASSRESLLAVLSSNEPNALYTYRFFFEGDEKLQSSWSKWTFAAEDTILSAEFLDSDLWLVVSRSEGTYLEVISLDPQRVVTGATFDVYLDSRVDETVCAPTYNSGANTTSFTVPWTIHTDETFKLFAGAGDATYRPFANVAFSKTAGSGTTTITVTGNLTKFYFGRTYEMRYRFSTIAMRDPAPGGGEETLSDGRLQLRRLTLNYTDSAYFTVEVTPKARDTNTYTFTARRVSSTIGDIQIESGTKSFGIMSKNDQVTIDIVNASGLPCFFTSAGWEGFFTIRSKRV